MTFPERMTGSRQARFGFHCSRRAGQRPDRSGQPHQIEPLAFEGFGGAGEPVRRLARRAALEGDRDQSGKAAMHAAQQMDGIGEITAGRRPRRFQKRTDVPMPRAPLGCDQPELGLGNAERRLLAK